MVLILDSLVVFKFDDKVDPTVGDGRKRFIFPRERIPAAGLSLGCLSAKSALDAQKKKKRENKEERKKKRELWERERDRKK